MKRVILDTETTGMPVTQGHRIIEIGCVEMLDRDVTGNHFHYYLNPERSVDEGAFAVHGLSDEFLSDKPLIAEVVDEFLAFIDGAELIIHNAKFDLGFLNNELALLGRKERIEDYCTIVDTLAMARDKHPGAKANLDALAKRYRITQFNRDLHGALLDAEILAQVYLALTGGQADMNFVNQSANKHIDVALDNMKVNISAVQVSDEELALHNDFFKK